MLCKQVLVTEDNDDTREMLVRTLASAGFRVDSAANGAEALNKLSRHVEPTLILLDLMMPVMDGWHFLQGIRRKDHRVVTISAVHSDTQEEEWQGIDGKLQKPLFAADLLAMVRNFCAPIEVGELALEPK